MKNIYKRKAWLVDDGILLEGYTAKRKFYPSDFGCGFSYQEIHKKDIGRILFYNKQEAIKKTDLDTVITQNISDFFAKPNK